MTLKDLVVEPRGGTIDVEESHKDTLDPDMSLKDLACDSVGNYPRVLISSSSSSSGSGYSYGPLFILAVHIAIASPLLPPGFLFLGWQGSRGGGGEVKAVWSWQKGVRNFLIIVLYKL